MSHPFPISRRALLGTAAMVGTAFAVGGIHVFGNAEAAAVNSSPLDFLKLSEFLTGGRPLDAALASRYLAALARHEAGFDESATTLMRYVADAGVGSIDDLVKRSDLTEPLRKTITQIVSSWYLGIVGVDEKAELISYEQALMYRHTMDVLVIPTYGGGPDSWGDKPAYLVAQANEKQS
ncbi:sugar dehydrogenase complex small subunit [soil metagenome]